MNACQIGMSLAIAAVLLAASSRAAETALQPVVEVEEVVYEYTSADNGAGPMWCHGSTCLVRLGDALFASGLETIPHEKPLNNCRWTFWRRGPEGWTLLQKDPAGRTREPCPLAAFPEPGRVFLSANPTLNPPGQAGGGPARPVLFEFTAADASAPPGSHWPGWRNHPAPPAFTEHSYRSLAADGPGRELILFQNIGYTHAEWAFRDRDGNWNAQGQLKWPWGAEYDTPQPIRVCYPNVALRARAVHFVGVSDIVEPYAKWRQAKRELTGQEWDYDFRRLFYTWSPDIARGGFRDWVEIASRDKTCGWVSPGDLWVAPDGAVHIVWTERALDERLRAKFFPNEKQRHELNYAVVREGRVRLRRTLLAADEGRPGLVASLPRFQPLPDHRLCVFFHVQGADETGKAVAENRLLDLGSEGSPGPMISVPLRHPLASYFTATVRAGSAPSWTLDLLGTRSDQPNAMCYARVRIEGGAPP
ncbi:MAG TPA: hypothetical protein PKM43_09685 [Verrucomicrobiota bacterium]|nr:hypothetical protein [Verrucomicrobiota bacterium]HRZ35214.1 hypothetical protein [Candidatus Paceibacterota bacterium]HRZ54156.1 hypothetical protein [Candidatus Paceibacterota bacterium]